MSPRAHYLWLPLLLSCSGGVDLDTAGEIRGTVTDAETGAPLAGVQVQTAPATERVSTEADGTYVLRAQLGVRYQVSAGLDGYAAASVAYTPQVSGGAPLDFALELVRICTPGARRCVQGDVVAAVQTCGPRGNLWEDAPCDEGQGCDSMQASCRDLRTLRVVLDAPGGVVRSQPVEGQPEAIVNCGNECEADFFVGTTVTLVATPLARSEFLGWRSGGCAGTDPTCVVELNQTTEVSAEFAASAFGLEVSTRGGGEGRVFSTPEGIDCGDECNAAFDRDVMVTLTAEPAAGSVFDAWQQDCSGRNPTCTLRMDENKRARARFLPEGVPVEVVRAGTGAGTVTSEPAGIDCGADCVSTFEDGATVTLTAIAAAGSTFVGWTGDCTGADPECDVVADAPRTVTATFDGIARQVVVELGGDGRVTSSPGGIDCGATCTASFAEGTMVELTAAADPGAAFAGWGLDCAAAGTNPVCSLVAAADRRARADFVAEYLQPWPEDPSCVALLHLDTPTQDEVRCGGSVGTASISGYAETPSRVAALGQARLAQGADEEGYIDIARLGAAPPTATLELTVRKDGPAFGARGRAALISDVDLSDPAGAGVRVLLLDDGTLAVSTRDGSGATSTASSAAGAIGNGTWYHVAATVDPAGGLGLFVDGVEVARTPGPVAWTASSSTTWVGAEREGPSGDAIHRLDGAVDEVRVSDVVRY